MRLEKYAGPNGKFTFPPQSSGKDNFGEVLPNTNRIGSISGGRDNLNGRYAPQGIGSVDAAWWISSKDSTTIRAQRDAVGAMAGWNKGRLFITTWPGRNEREDKRWCAARLNNVRMSEASGQTPHLQQQVQASFQVADPGWRGGQKRITLDAGHSLDDGWRLEGAKYLDEGHRLDSGVFFNPVKLEVQATNGGSYTVVNNGTRRALAVVRVSATEDPWTLRAFVRLGDGHYFNGAVVAVSNITLTHTFEGKTLTQCVWGDTLQPGEELIIDGEKQSVLVQGSGGQRSGYSGWQPQIGFGFFEFPPGESTISISGGIGPRGCKLIVDFWDTFFTS